ncbi:hypothetical protein BDW59DRAFT_164935 [Aspergillus cavernicola]|uniref:Transcription factor domain-containing protein n=1 Tax=Aspergillus cavernicola TaxID=176166 RepID=A0ABR4HVT6_9EURO
MQDLRHTSAIYAKCVKMIPEWRTSATGTLMDLQAAFLLMSAAAERLDYDLCWVMCQEIYQYATTLNLHILDDQSSSANTDPHEHDIKRKLVWHVIKYESLIALSLRRPTNLLFSNFHVGLPLLTSDLPVDTITPFVLRSEITFIVSRFLRLIQSSNHTGPEGHYMLETERCCQQLEALLFKWNHYEILPDTSGLGFILDYLTFGHTSLLFMDRITYEESPPSDRALYAARKSLQIIRLAAKSRPQNPLTILACVSPPHTPSVGLIVALSSRMISLYPFEAFFTLHCDLASKDKHTIAEDRALLEDFATILHYIVPAIGAVAPLAHAVDYINIITRELESDGSPINWLYSAPSQRNAFVKRPDPAALSHLGDALNMAIDVLGKS